MEKLFYWIVWSFCRLVLVVYNRLSVRGVAGALAVEPPVIIAANHCSNLDPVVAGVSIPRRLRYLAKSELFRIPVLGMIIKVLGAVPARREDLQGAASAVKFLIDRIESGESVLLFPEGQRSFDGKLQPLEGGVGLLAVKTGAPVIPVYIDGTFRAMPRGSGGYRPSKIRAAWGEPIFPGDLPDDMPSRKKREAVTLRLEQSLRSLETEITGAGKA